MKNPTTMTGCILLGCLAALVFGLALLVGWQFLSPKGRVSCASFGAYSDALSAYKNGSTWLDGNGNGTPCESLAKQAGIAIQVTP